MPYKDRKKRLEYFKNYNHKRKESHTKYMRDWNKMNKDKKHGYTKKTYEKLRLEIITLLGSKCSNPFNLNHGDFIADIRCLQIDHVNGGGSKLLTKSPYKEYKRIRDEIKTNSKDYQLLCANCNWIKRRINNEN